jgi:hypothetical protein
MLFFLYFRHKLIETMITLAIAGGVSCSTHATDIHYADKGAEDTSVPNRNVDIHPHALCFGNLA